MTYRDLKFFMDKLIQLIYNNDYPLIRNHIPSISPVRAQLQRLYQELHSTIRILFTEKENHLDELEEVTNLKKRFEEVAEEAHEKVDLFVSVVNFKDEIISPNSDDLELSLDLRDIMGSINSIKMELNIILKMDSSRKTQSPAPAAASCTRISLGSNKQWDESIVGLDEDAILVRDKLIEDQKRLDVVSIVGTGGIGKTTLATKVFNDPYVMYYFDLRAWVTVSQNYDKQEILIKILESVGVKVEPEISMYSKLREKLHKSLMRKRYLIVIDDIWNTKAWDDIKVFFPNDNIQSRILLTSRLKEVALHARPDGFIHQLDYLTDEKSWELLRKKVFNGDDCPKSLITPGIQIAKGCRGLPLALVVIAGVLAKEATSLSTWERIAQNVTSYIVRDIDTVVLSFDHLPGPLRDCFLYLGGFQEDYEFSARRLMWLWVAEGFIQESRNESLEEIAQGYLMELVDRNLVLVRSRKLNGTIKTFSVHDILRELCLKIASKEKFIFKKNGSDLATYKTRRVFTNCLFDIDVTTKIRSFLYIQNRLHYMVNINTCFSSWLLLRVLDLQQYNLNCFQVQITLLVHLRYLAIRFDDEALPFTICNLRSLQTLVIERGSRKPLVLPDTISDLVSLRHLWVRGKVVFPPIQKPMNLQTISEMVVKGGRRKNWVKYFPSVRKLSCYLHKHVEFDFKSLNYLEILTVTSCSTTFQKESVMFPDSLKKLTLKGFHLPWICMSKLQSLPKLEMLVILDDAFVGPCWDVGEQPFQQLKILKLDGLDIKQWKASSINFPCLKQLFWKNCTYLEEIPLEIGEIPTLERIVIIECKNSVLKSVSKIKTEQHDYGNFDLEIKAFPMPDFQYFLFELYSLCQMRISDNLLTWPGIDMIRPFPVPIYYRSVFRAWYDQTTCSSRRWNDQRTRRYPIRRKFSNKDGGLRLLQY